MMASRKFRRIISLIALVFTVGILQGCPLRVQLEPCENSGGVLEANCWKHKMGQWPSDATNYPNCSVWSTSNDGFATHSMLLVVVRRRPAGRAN
jgi:hypothetical protein